METLQQYDMVVRHIYGSDNTAAVVPDTNVDADLQIRAAHTPTQTDEPQVNLVTTGSMARALVPADINVDLQPVPLKPSDTTFPVLILALSVSASSIVNDLLHLDHARLNHLQN
jgi:hypothetical protein